MEYFQVVDNKTTKVYEISNLNADIINQKLKNTYLSECGDILYDIEQNYGINFRFIYAVGALESGHGKKCINVNNYFGIKSKNNIGYRAFESKGECLYFLAKLMNMDLYKNKDIDVIGSIYCPTDSTWASKVKNIMLEV